MRALLLFNPNATSTDEAVRDVIASALSSELDLEVHPTKQRGHATHITAGAVHDGIDVVFALGGDGTANEVIQAVAGSDVRLGVLPGGSTNVLVRTLGLPNEPVAATSVMLRKLRNGETRTVSLGVANGRYFATSAGFGFDAAVVRLVERRYRLKRAVRQLSFVWCALQEFFLGYDRTELPVRADVAGSTHGPYGMVIVGNTTPFTYLGNRALNVTPDASFDRRLDLVGFRTMRTAPMLRIVGQVFTTAGHVRSDTTDYLRDLDSVTLRSDVTLPLQVDGDYAGEHREVTLTSVPDALHLLA